MWLCNSTHLLLSNTSTCNVFDRLAELSIMCSLVFMLHPRLEQQTFFDLLLCLTHMSTVAMYCTILCCSTTVRLLRVMLRCMSVNAFLSALTAGRSTPSGPTSSSFTRCCLATWRASASSTSVCLSALSSVSLTVSFSTFHTFIFIRTCILFNFESTTRYCPMSCTCNFVLSTTNNCLIILRCVCVPDIATLRYI